MEKNDSSNYKQTISCFVSIEERSFRAILTQLALFHGIPMDFPSTTTFKHTGENLTIH